MYRITYVLGVRGELRDRSLRILLAALTQCGVAYLRAYPRTPKLYASGVRYEEEPGEQDDWQDIPSTLHHGHGDAEDFACWRAAELQVQGVDAWPSFEFQGAGGKGPCRLYPRVRLPNGQFEDPSAVLGAPKSTKPCMALENSSGETRLTFVVDVFKGSRGGVREQALANRTLQIMLAALTQIDVLYLRAFPATPRLYDMGVRYEEEPPGREDWQDIPTTMKRGNFDCEDGAAHRAAELQVKDGIMAWPTFNWRLRPSGAYLYHVQTRYPDGRIEDPSRRLGMR